MKQLKVLVIASVILVVLVFLFSSANSGNVAIVPINGVILSTDSFGAVALSQNIVQYLQSANEDESILAIVVEINSPGGTPVASKEIADTVSSIDKPVYALIRESGTSGAYWVASASDVIYADEVSIVGSIGVLASFVDFSGLLSDNNITYQRLVGGEFKDIGSPFKPLTAAERKILQERIDRLHEIFIQHVAANRNMDIEKIREIANGEFYLGVEALDLGLVDTLGNINTVKKDLSELLGVEVEFVRYEREPGLLSVLGKVIGPGVQGLNPGIRI